MAADVFMTQAGKKVIDEELRILITQDRETIKKALAEARAFW